ncbi:MAG: thiamine phosphate synthase [Saccharospirillaceae bacterium]|nr:thiamine phosphate synthase [Pseudomonadales bacterium]NRB79393.1 thiamine phosphate synthase [Saccharospirillaceae bacterium]
MNMKTVWTIAAQDSAGISGISADVRVFESFNCHVCQITTAVTAQSIDDSVSIQKIDANIIKDQLNVLLKSHRPDAIKIGVLIDKSQVDVIVDFLAEHNLNIPIVFDPVLSATSGLEFNVLTLNDLKPLLKFVTVFTPNTDELSILSNGGTQAILDCAVKALYLKGGHTDLSVDYFVDQLITNNSPNLYFHNLKQNKKIRATGCSFSSLLAVYLMDYPVNDAVTMANASLQKSIKTSEYKINGFNILKSFSKSIDLNDYPDVSHCILKTQNKAFELCAPLELYPVVDSVLWIKKLAQWGVKTLQIRIKDQTGEELENSIKQATLICKEHDIQFFVNDYWQLAIKYNAYGVHLGQEDIQVADIELIRKAGVKIGISTHGETEFCIAKSIKPSYIAIGAIFPTDTKEVQVVGLDNLSKWVEVLTPNYPLCAIGGIGFKNIKTVLDSQVGSVALVSAICSANEPQKATKSLLEYFEH